MARLPSTIPFDELIEIFRNHNFSPTNIARTLGVTKRTIDYWLARPEIKKARNAEGLELLGLQEEQAKNATLDSLKVAGTSRYYKLEDGGMWVKTTEDKAKQQEALDDIVSALTEDLPKVKQIKAPKHAQDDLCLVIPIGDAHIGMYAWAEESGDDFNLEIAERDLCAGFKHLIDQSPETAKCIIVNVGDFLHYNGMVAQTDRHKHALDASGRPQEMRKVGMKVLRFCIEYAATKHKVVESINAGGNHDDTTMGIFNLALSNIYEDNPNIIIHCEPTTRHYSRFGKCLFGVTHGHLGKDSDLPAIMATERPEDWGKTVHRTWFRGHHHHDSKVEDKNTRCFVEQVRTMAAPDAYASGGGYFSGRDIKSIIFHKDLGELRRNICSTDLLKLFVYGK